MVSASITVLPSLVRQQILVLIITDRALCKCSFALSFLVVFCLMAGYCLNCATSNRTDNCQTWEMANCMLLSSSAPKWNHSNSAGTPPSSKSKNTSLNPHQAKRDLTWSYAHGFITHYWITHQAAHYFMIQGPSSTTMGSQPTSANSQSF